MSTREVLRTVRGEATSDGAGVRLTRVIGTSNLNHLDPFLLLDEFKSEEAADYIGGFPDHPHRGFETVTYMLAGSMQHRDHRGNQGNLVAGSVQWMTAGRGIVHSEMPQQEEGLLWGFQLWVNLPATHKLTEPRYQDVPPEAVPEVELDSGTRIRVIAGSSGTVEGAVSGIVTRPLYLDVAVPPTTLFEHAVPHGHNAFLLLYEGAALAGPTEVDSGQALTDGDLAVLGDGDSVVLRAGDRGARLLLVAGQPLNEPIVRYGPFVMNTKDEILEAVRDFREGRLEG